jgi:biopolymer transport protein ExbB
MRRAPFLTACSALIAFCAALGASLPARPASFEAAQGEIDARLKRSLQELADTRDAIAKEKIPLSRGVSQLEDEVLELRQKRARLLETRDSRTIDLESLRKQVQSLKDQEEFTNSRLNEFVREFEGRLDISELPQYEKLTAAAKLAEKNVNLEPEQRRATQLAVVKAALGRVREQLGGRVYAGAALSPEGVLTEGRFVAFGPSVFFSSPDGRVSGLVEAQLNAADPVVVALPGGLDDDIAAVANDGGHGLLPFDATMGKAVKIEKARESLMAHIEKGGAVGYIIIALGLAALALAIFKGIEILGLRVAEPREVDGVLNALAKGDPQAAALQAERVEGVAGEMLAIGVKHAKEKREVVEELLFEKLLKVRPLLERYLPFLAITATAAPLLGLLGTVTGMIKTFQLLTIFGTGDAKSLSSGISEALVTTELGLMVAIPTLILHGLLSRMVKQKLGVLEQVSMGFVNGLEAMPPHERAFEAPASHAAQAG